MPVLNTSNTNAIYITAGKKKMGISLDDGGIFQQESLWKTEA